MGDILDDASFEAEQMNKTLDVTSHPGSWPLYCNPSAIGSAFENIVRNALRYSNTHIAVDFKEENNGILITVDDDGPGLVLLTASISSDRSIVPMKLAIEKPAVQGLV